MPSAFAAPVAALLADSAQSWGAVALWSAVLFLLLCAGMVVIIFIRRAVQQTADAGNPDGFTLHGLRELHAQGLIDDAEFERARAALIERVKTRPAAENEDASTRLLRELHARRDGRNDGGVSG